MKLTLLLFLTVFTLTGQSIEGTILDAETNTPLAYVNVYFAKEKVGTESNAKGEFKLKLQSALKKRDTLRFSIVGYNPKTYTISKLKAANFKVFLIKKIENLDEITITSTRKLKRNLVYKKRTPLKKGLFGFGTTLIDNKIYIIGGDESLIVDTAKKTLDEVGTTPESTFADFIKKTSANLSWEHYSDKLQTYDIEKDTWLTSNLTFKKRAYHDIISLNDTVYVLGGKTLSRNRKFEYLDNNIEVLDLNSQQVSIDHTNPHQAVNFATFAYRDKMIVLGGSVKLKDNGEKNYTDKSHIYNIASGYWYELPKMTKPKEVNGILIKDKIYLIGGFNKNPLKEIEYFDLISGEWKNEGNLFNGIEHPALTSHENTIYIFNDGKLLTFNIETHILNEFNIDLDLKNAQLYYYKNHLYIIGGYTEENFTKSPSAGVYSIHLNEFATTRIMNSKATY